MKFVLPCLIAAALWGNAQAAQFTYTGFYHEETAQWRPTASISGYFESHDLDGDGIHERNEVTEFVINGQRFVGGCGEASLCGLWNFSWVPGGALDFSASYGMLSSETGEAWADWKIDSGVRVHSIWNTGSGWKSDTLSWRPETTLLMTSVPEPGAYAMLAVGLAVIGLRRRRKPEQLRG